MGLEIIKDELIEHLLKTKKQVDNPGARKKIEYGHERENYLLLDDEGNRFKLYLRQNRKQGMEDDFSCGLSYILPSGEAFTLVRYNGPSHNHLNRLEKEETGYTSHIHKATCRYLDETGKADGYAEPTKRFTTLDGALFCLLKDCHVSGINAKADQPDLF